MRALTRQRLRRWTSESGYGTQKTATFRGFPRKTAVSTGIN